MSGCTSRFASQSQWALLCRLIASKSFGTQCARSSNLPQHLLPNICRRFSSASTLMSHKKDSGRWVRDDAKILAEAVKQADARSRNKVVLQDEHGTGVTTCTLVEAEAYAKQRNMKLFLVDDKKLLKTYRLINREELLALEESQKAIKAEKKVNKVRKFGTSIADHDLQIKLRDVAQLLADGFSVSLHVSYTGSELKDENLKEKVRASLTCKVADTLSTHSAAVRVSQCGSTSFVLSVNKAAHSASR